MNCKQLLISLFRPPTVNILKCICVSLSLSPPPIYYNSVLLIMIHISLISLIIVSAGGVGAIVLAVTQFK